MGKRAPRARQQAVELPHRHHDGDGPGADQDGRPVDAAARPSATARSASGNGPRAPPRASRPSRFFIWSRTRRVPAPTVKPTMTLCET